MDVATLPHVNRSSCFPQPHVRAALCFVSIFIVALPMTACHRWPRGKEPPSFPDPAATTTSVPEAFENPLFVPVQDREFLWNQIVDTVDNDFRIDREERVHYMDGVLTEGRVDTFPEVGKTLLEFWQKDSPSFRERLHATFQSVRRQAHLRVTPTQGGYLISVFVHKELEDVSQPEHASVGAIRRRHDGTLRSNDDEFSDRDVGILGGPVTLGWIPLGRDFAMEQKILEELHGRLFNIAPK